MGRWLLSASLLGASCVAVAARQGVAGIELSIEPRTAEQLSAFYSVRGMPAPAVARLTAACFFTVAIRNTRSDSALLDLSQWRVRNARGDTLKRITRPQWDAQWRALAVPAAARSTFNWTQLPETRALQPDEPVAGNFALIPAPGPLTLEAAFPIAGAQAVTVKIPGLRCAQADVPKRND